MAGHIQGLDLVQHQDPRNPSHDMPSDDQAIRSRWMDAAVEAIQWVHAGPGPGRGLDRTRLAQAGHIQVGPTA
jgi:hypothetical protein